jgi:hypothetical protein
VLRDAILQRILHLPPETIFRGVLSVVFIAGMTGNMLVSAFFQILENTPRAKARKRRELNAELQRKYESACAELREALAERDAMAKENSRLIGLLREEHSHNRDWDIRTRRELDTMNASGGG